MYKDKNKKGKTKNVEEINEKWDGKLDLSILKVLTVIYGLFKF